MNPRIERHVITGEYPPDVGGVGDYTAILAAALVGCGERVHVWCRGTAGSFTADDVTVHRSLGRIRSADLKRLSSALESLPAPRRLLVQWVPHAFGRRSLNLTFCRWLYRRRMADGDDIDVIVHEPFLPFSASPGAVIAAAVHRVMVAYLLRAAARVWVATPAWTHYLRPYAPPRELGFGWLPVPSTILAAQEPAAGIRHDVAGDADLLIGTFATGGRYTGDALAAAVMPILAGSSAVHLLLLGSRSAALGEWLIRGGGAPSEQIHSTGYVPAARLARLVAACDLGVQPYADGVCGRQTTAMAFLAQGRPLVTTDGRFTEHVWRGGAVGLASASAPDRLRRITEELLARCGDREKVARAGRELYDSRFAVRHTAAALHAAIA